MTDLERRDIAERLAGLEAKVAARDEHSTDRHRQILQRLDAIDRQVAGPPSVDARLTRLEAVAPNTVELTAGVADNKVHVEVAAALQSERERSAAALRNTIALVATLAGTISGTVVAMIGLLAGTP